MDEPSAFRTFSLREHWLLLAILLLATLLRLWQINESLWLDELHSAWVVSAGASEILERAQIGNQSPLYFFLPWATTSLFGVSEWALRLPSLVAGVGLVAVAYGLAYGFTRSPIAASATAILSALDHNFLFYATETRPYACVQIVAAVQLYFFWSLQNRVSLRRRVGFVGASVVLFYLHYTTVLLLAGEIAFSSLVACFRHKRGQALDYTLRQLTVDLLCIAALAVPAMTRLIDIGSRRGTWASFINDTSLLLPSHWFSLVSYVVMPTIACLAVSVAKAAIARRRDDTVTLSFVFGATSDGSSNASSPGSSRRRATSAFDAALLLACWLGVPLAIVWLLTVTKVAPLYLGRYVIGAALAPVLFVGLCIGVWSSKKLQMLVAGLVIAYAVLSSGMIEQLRYDGRLFGDRVENWRAAVSYVNDDRRRSILVFVRSGLLEADRLATEESELLRSYCVSPVTSIYHIERPNEEIRPLTTSNAGALTKEDVKRIEATTEAWFIINGTAVTRKRCRERVIASLTGGARRVVVLDEREFGYVGVFRVVLRHFEADADRVISQPTSPNSSAFP